MLTKQQLAQEFLTIIFKLYLTVVLVFQSRGHYELLFMKSFYWSTLFTKSHVMVIKSQNQERIISGNCMTLILFLLGGMYYPWVWHSSNQPSPYTTLQDEFRFGVQLPIPGKHCTGKVVRSWEAGRTGM